jgi:hypothetical protein
MGIIWVALLMGRCQTLPEAVSHYRNIELRAPHPQALEVLREDLDYLYQLTLSPSWAQAFQKIDAISIDQKNCSGGQVACAFSDRPNKIFLKPEFLKLSRWERLGTLLHESEHHQRSNYQHISCQSTQIKNTECDADLSGAFGQEYQFYQQLLKSEAISKNKKNREQVLFLLHATQVRINSLL